MAPPPIGEISGFLFSSTKIIFPFFPLKLHHRRHLGGGGGLLQVSGEIGQ
jgi:hypothetical protein